MTPCRTTVLVAGADGATSALAAAARTSALFILPLPVCESDVGRSARAREGSAFLATAGVVRARAAAVLRHVGFGSSLQRQDRRSEGANGAICQPCPPLHVSRRKFFAPVDARRLIATIRSLKIVNDGTAADLFSADSKMKPGDICYF